MLGCGQLLIHFVLTSRPSTHYVGGNCLTFEWTPGERGCDLVKDDISREGLYTTAASADTECMDKHYFARDSKRAHEAWLAGYQAAVDDAVCIVETLGGPAFSNLSAPVLIRLRTRLLELRADVPHMAA